VKDAYGVIQEDVKKVEVVLIGKRKKDEKESFKGKVLKWYY
jgi:hypothetical protein